MLQRKPDRRRDDKRNGEIYRRALAGEKHKDIAKDFGINVSRVEQIVYREKRFLLFEKSAISKITSGCLGQISPQE